MTDRRKLSRMSFYRTSADQTASELTFMVYRETSSGTYTRVASVTTTSDMACASNYCGVDFDGVVLQAGSRYLLAMHDTASQQSHLYQASARGEIPGGTVAGGYRVVTPSLPAETWIGPVTENRTYWMTVVTDQPD